MSAAYDKAVVERRWSKRSRDFNLICMVLLTLAYAFTIGWKGWHDRYLIGLMGFTLLGGQAYLRQREYRMLDVVIRDYEKMQAAFPFNVSDQKLSEKEGNQ